MEILEGLKQEDHPVGVGQLFFTKIHYKKTCGKDASHVSENLIEFSPAFFHLQIADSSKSSIPLPEMIEAHFLPVVMDDYKVNDLPECSICKVRSRHTDQKFIYQLPTFIMFSIVRCVHLPRERRLVNPIDFPLENLDMSPYVTPKSSNPLLYNLVAILQHGPTCTGGHYKAFTKNPKSGKWHLHNDVCRPR